MINHNLEEEYFWKQEDMIEVLLKEPDDFLKVKETLTRIGIASKKEKKLFQSCHILHKQGKYYLTHFKELFKLDKKQTFITHSDIDRRDSIIKLLSQWELLTVVEPSRLNNTKSSDIKVIPYKEKAEWVLEAKYSLGTKNVKKTD